MEAIGDLFGGTKPPPPAPAPAPPSKDETMLADREAAAAAAARRSQMGRASTMLTSSLGDTSTPSLASKQLLGQ